MACPKIDIVSGDGEGGNVQEVLYEDWVAICPHLLVYELSTQ